MPAGHTLWLGIETSCDETSAAVVQSGSEVLSNIIASQVDIHRRFGGVVPEIASRQHLELVNGVVAEALQAAGTELGDLTGIAVTNGPGLVGALVVGIATAKAMAFAASLPLLGINHMAGHIYANFLQSPQPEFPFVCLVVSGGHTDIVYMPEHLSFELLGRTRDDAAGEVFDKTARAMGLGYPGGPVIDRLAAEGNPAAVDFPRARLEEGSFDFSFSGLKTAVLRYFQSNPDVPPEDTAASFQRAVVDVLAERAFRACDDKGVERLVLAGGVAVNSELRRRFAAEAEQRGIELHIPAPILCTDNAAMIASVAHFRYLRGDSDPLTLDADANLPL
ncbi:MAG: tRNA (adenosine(37)-N6)-threonylcarbamoyltransferase complex transferase subunit TsaD [bacterium]|nr:tRNA (adenosine(37)-N6)-threonylcarbamoyltransferase complex transferase subunit TsaD [bacterium]